MIYVTEYSLLASQNARSAMMQQPWCLAQASTLSLLLYIHYIHCMGKKSHHFHLSKQIGKSILLYNYCIGNYLSAGRK